MRLMTLKFYGSGPLLLTPVSSFHFHLSHWNSIHWKLIHAAIFDEDSIGVCEPNEAQFWSVYVHLVAGGVECIADFASEDLAKQFVVFLETILSMYHHPKQE